SDNNDSFAFSVADPPGTAATGTFAITFTEAPTTVTVNTALNLGEGTTAVITSAKLTAVGDAGDPASEFVYTITTAPTHGTLKINNVALAVNGTFTQGDINTGKVSYTQVGTNNNDSFAFSVVHDGTAPATGTFAIILGAPTITVNTGSTVP